MLTLTKLVNSTCYSMGIFQFPYLLPHVSSAAFAEAWPCFSSGWFRVGPTIISHHWQYSIQTQSFSTSFQHLLKAVSNPFLHCLEQSTAFSVSIEKTYLLKRKCVTIETKPKMIWTNAVEFEKFSNSLTKRREYSYTATIVVIELHENTEGGVARWVTYDFVSASYLHLAPVNHQAVHAQTRAKSPPYRRPDDGDHFQE